MMNPKPQIYLKAEMKFVGVIASILALLLMSAPAVSGADDGVLRAALLSGDLPNASTIHYLSVEPIERDDTVTLTLLFGPSNNRQVANMVNFWVLDESGWRSYQAGSKAYQVALAAGNRIYGKDDDYQVQASFKVTGHQRYSVLVQSRALVPASYTLTAKKGMLIDHSGFTRAIAEAEVIAAPEVIAPQSLATFVAKNQMTAQLSRIGQEDYYNLKPLGEKNDDVTITMDFDPKNNNQLTGSINFFVLNRSGMNELKAGKKPYQVNVAAGNIVKSGETKLNAKFKAVRGEVYTVIVTSHSNIPATYTLTVSGSTFE